MPVDEKDPQDVVNDLFDDLEKDLGAKAKSHDTTRSVTHSKRVLLQDYPVVLEVSTAFTHESQS